MAQRYFDSLAFTLERNVTSLYARCTFGASGAITLVTTAAALPTGNSLANVGGSPSKGWLSAVKTATGLYTFTLGGPQISQIDTYYHIDEISVLWDTSGNSATAPAAPLVSLITNSIRTGKIELEFTNATGTNVATNPASGEACFIELIVSNSNTY